MASYAKRALRGAATVFTLSLVSALMVYLLRLLLARKLTVEDYGLFFALFSLINILTLFKDFGLGYALVKFIPELQVAKNWNRIKTLIASSFVMRFISATIIAVIMIAAGSWIMENFFHNYNTYLLTIFAFMFVLAVPQNVISVSMQAFQRTFIFAVQDLSRNLTVLVITFILLRIGFGVAAPAWAYLLMHIIVFLIFFSIFSTKVFTRFWKSRISFTQQEFSTLISFGLPAMLTIFANNVLQHIDTLMLSYFTDLTTVGLYQVAVPLAGMVLYFSHATSIVATPMVSELKARKEIAKLKQGISLIHKYLFIIILPAAGVLAAFPEIFIRLLFGEKFIEAALALQILSVGAVFLTVGFVNLNLLFGLGKPKSGAKIMVSAVIINIILNGLLIPNFGMVGAASATAISFLFMFCISTIGIRKVAKVKPSWSLWARILTAAVVFVGVLAAIKGFVALNPWVELIICITAGGILYMLLLFLLRLVTREEFQWFLNQLGIKRLSVLPR